MSENESTTDVPEANDRSYDIRVNATLAESGGLSITATLGDAEVEYRFPGEAGSDAEVLAEAGPDLLASVRSQLYAALAAQQAEDEPVEGCPDCGKDTVVSTENAGDTHCSDCGWRP